MERIEGKIAAILDRTTVVINRGSRDGVSRSDEFYIYSEVGPFVDPDTGETLGTTRKIWGKVAVSTVEDRFSIAQTGYSSILDFVGRGLLGRQPLPVDGEAISTDLTHITVVLPVISASRVSMMTKDEGEALPEPSGKEPEGSQLSQTEGKTEREDGAASES